MPIFHEHKALQVHIPKTAGTTISHILGLKRELSKSPTYQKEYLFGEQGLRKHGTPYQHMTFSEICEEVKAEVLDEYFKFTFVRNPWDRLVSELFWINSQRAKIKPPLDLDQIINGAKAGSRRLIPQVNYIKNKQGKCDMDYIGSFENFKEDWLEVSDILEVPITAHTYKSNCVGYLVNKTSERIFLQEGDGPIINLLPDEKIDAFKRSDFEEMSNQDEFIIKVANSIKDLKSQNFKIYHKIPKGFMLKSEKMNLAYEFLINDADTQLSTLEFSCDSNLWLDYKLVRPDMGSYELKNTGVDIYNFNKINRKNYREYYNTKSEKAVRKLYEEDIDTFRYTF